jgi:hypothetical protein
MHSVSQWWKARRADRAYAAEIAGIDDAELTAMNLTRAEFTDLARMAPERIALMETMAGQWGLSRDALRREWADIDIAQRCQSCAIATACARAAAGEGSVQCACPNAAAFETMAAA